MHSTIPFKIGKLSIFIYITIALLFLLLISHNSTKPSSHPHCRLKLRSNFNFTNPLYHRHDAVAFDPLMADIERRREDREWEKKLMENSHPELVNHDSQPEYENSMDAEEYLNDEDKFNVTDRLVLLLPKIDVDPMDGYVSEHELTKWNLQQAMTEVMHRTQREMDVYDKNHDGVISFSEYVPPSWIQNSDKSAFGYDMGWWGEEHFNASDADGDGLLNITEFNSFLHPAGSKNIKLLQWLCKEEVRERDSDKDRKVNFKEFFHGIFDLVRNYDEENTTSIQTSDDSNETPAKALFAQLDKDGDGFLSDAELLPIIGKLNPSEHYYAKQQSDYIMSQADADKDGRLSLKEMIDNPYVFYSAIFSDEDDDYDFHDEFR